MDNTIRLLICPSCGAPLDPQPGAITMKCGYCSNTVVIPESSRLSTTSSGAEVDMNRVASQAARMREVIELVRAGNKIEAIKRFREITDSGLKEAKDAVDAIEAGRGIEVNMLVEAGARVGQSLGSLDAHGRIPPPRSQAIVPDLSSEMRPKRSTSGWLGCAIFILVAGIVAYAVLPSLLNIPNISALVSTTGGENQPGVGTTSVFSLPVQVTPTPSFANVLLSFGEEGSGPGLLDDPRYVGVDRDSNIYVGDYGDGRIQVFDSQGKFLRMINIGENIARGMAVTFDGRVYLAYGGKVHIFDTNGTETGTLSYDGYIDHITLGADGSLYAADNHENILRFDPNGDLNLTIPQAFTSVTDHSELDITLAVDGLGNIYALGSFNNLVLKYSPDGKFIDRFGGDTTHPAEGVDPGRFQASYTITVDGYGRIYVSDIWGIQVFSPDGQYLTFFEIEGVAFGMSFDLDNNLFIASSKPGVIQLSIQRP